MTNTITNETSLIFTETKKGRATPCKTYECTASRFIQMVKDKDCDGDLNVGVEPILNAEGEIESFTADKFYELPVQEQLDRCCRSEGERYAATIAYVEAVDCFTTHFFRE